MRVIGGKHGGRRLVSFNAGHIRPTTDRVKEVIFNKLQAEVDGVEVLDLFSGTGSLGIEALSRGAEYVTFVEQSQKSIKILEKNLEQLKINTGYEIIRSDVLKFLKKNLKSYDIVLVDPPFSKKMADEVMTALSQSDTYHENSVIVIESLKQEVLKEIYSPLSLLDQKDYGDKYLSFFHTRSDDAFS